MPLQAQLPSNQPIELKWADVLNGTRGINGNIKDFSGNVTFQQADVIVKCDRAVHYADEDRIELFGNVHINQKSLDLYTSKGTYDGRTRIAQSDTKVKIVDGKTTLTANNGIYSTDSRIASFNGDVKIEDDSVIITSDKVIWNKLNRNSFATGNVFISGKYSNAYLSGDTINHFPEQNFNEAKGNPRLFQIDTLRYDESLEEYLLDTLSVSADYMISHKGTLSEKYDFYKNVEIRRSNIASKSDTAVYDKDSGLIWLMGGPVVWYDSTRLFADSIKLDLPGMKLNKLSAYGNSFAATRDDTSDITRISQIAGNDIVIHFENDSIRTIFSFGNAKSLYFMKSDSVSEGAQRSSCDTLNVFFIDGRPDNILWLGGVNGDFYPDNMIPSANQLYLPGFRWSDAIPKKVTLIKRN